MWVRDTHRCTRARRPDTRACCPSTSRYRSRTRARSGRCTGPARGSSHCSRHRSPHRSRPNQGKRRCCHRPPTRSTRRSRCNWRRRDRHKRSRKRPSPRTAGRSHRRNRPGSRRYRDRCTRCPRTRTRPRTLRTAARDGQHEDEQCERQHLTDRSLRHQSRSRGHTLRGRARSAPTAITGIVAVSRPAIGADALRQVYAGGTEAGSGVARTAAVIQYHWMPSIRWRLFETSQLSVPPKSM